MMILIVGSLIYKIELIKIFKENVFIFVILFFIVIIYSTLFDSFSEVDNNNFIKSLLYLRYLILLLVLNCMMKNDDFNLKFFLLSCLFFSFILSLDIIFQYFVGQDIFGFKSRRFHNSGFFDDELIAGGYIQRFAILGIFSLPLIFYNNKKKLFITLSISLFISVIGIILSGNRMPLILYFLFIFIAILFLREIRGPLIITFISGILVFLLVANSNRMYQDYWISFKNNIKNFLPKVNEAYDKEKLKLKSEKGKIFIEEWYEGKKGNIKLTHFGSGHAIIYVTAFDTWRDKLFLGSGIKSFRIKCKTKLHLPNRVCSSHPHNYYLEILNDTGLLGGILFFGSVFYILIRRLKKYSKNKNGEISNDFILLAISMCLIIEIFPLKSSGSFFSTYNSAFIFLLMGLLSNSQDTKKIKN